MFNCFQISTIRKILLIKLIRKMMFFPYLLNSITPKNSNEIVAFIDFEINNGNKHPYKNDNVFILCEYIKKNDRNINITFIPSNQFGGRKTHKISTQEKLFLFWKRLIAKTILCKQPPSLNNFYNKKQQLICLGYFIPFKSDYFDLNKFEVFYSRLFKQGFSAKNCQKYKALLLESLTYKKGLFDRTNMTYITASRFASEAIARSHNLPITSFLELGSPKSDATLFEPIDIRTIFKIPSSITHIFLYTPTFRDKYIHSDLKDIPEEELTIFGYSDEQSLGKLLMKNNIAIIIKLHKSFPFYRDLEELLTKNKQEPYIQNCYFLDFEIESEHSISIYNLFSQSDAMIADYSSISFDYLSQNKPLIYNIPDIDDYRQYRGFSYEPIEEIMPGYQVKTIESLKSAILNVINEDNYKHERNIVLSKVNEIPQGEALDNIYDFIKRKAS